MRKKLYCISLFFLSILFFTQNAFAQFGFLKPNGVTKIPERGTVIQLGAGLAGVKSDICGSWGCNDIGPNVSIGALYKMTPFVGVSAELDYQRLGATEKFNTAPLNIAFRSEVIELSVLGVFNLLDSYSGSSKYRSSRKRFVVPFVKAGIGFIYYTPISYPAEGNQEDSQVRYDPERNYPAVAGVIPFGGGLRFRFSDRISIAPELMYHMTTTDYLDNIGPRLGNASTKDHYGVAAIKVQYTPNSFNNIFSRKNQGK